MCTHPPPPQGVNGALYVRKLYSSSGIDISKCIEGGSMKLTTLVDYIYVCAVTNTFPCNECNFFNVFNFLFLFNFFKHIFLDLVKAKPIRYCIELPV